MVFLKPMQLGGAGNRHGPGLLREQQGESDLRARGGRFHLYNNALYNAVRRAASDMYPRGVAAGEGGWRPAELSHGPAFEKVTEAQGGHGERVECPADLSDALQRAAVAMRAGMQALVNVICSV